jgi:hypothetical protein
MELTPHKDKGNNYARKEMVSGQQWQDDLGRLNDLLTCLRYGIKKSPSPSTEITFQIDVMNNKREPTKTITLKGTCTPWDDLEPVITVMFPEED